MAESRSREPAKIARTGNTRGLILYVVLGICGLSAGFLTAKFLGGSPQDGQALLPGQGGNYPAAQGIAGLYRLPDPRPLPGVSFTDANGRDQSLSNWRGKFVLVNLWATWCAPCKTEMASLDRLQAKLGSSDFAVVAISTDRGGPELPAAFFAKEGIRNLQVFNDRKSAATIAWGAQGLPFSIILDRQGREVAYLLGPAEWDSPEAAAKLQELIAAAPG